jgi:hypothetical protein
MKAGGGARLEDGSGSERYEPPERYILWAYAAFPFSARGG